MRLDASISWSVLHGIPLPHTNDSKSSETWGHHLSHTNSSAEVIKIEKPQSGDDTRAWGPPFAQPLPEFATSTYLGESAYFLAVLCSPQLTQVNRNKKSVALNFKHPESLAVLHKIVQSCDVIVENYIPGTLKKFGLDYLSLSRKKPKLIYASITGMLLFRG
jgi:succinate--hydroxymethylglutarate CoA-transferase